MVGLATLMMMWVGTVVTNLILVGVLVWSVWLGMRGRDRTLTIRGTPGGLRIQGWHGSLPIPRTLRLDPTRVEMRYEPTGVDEEDRPLFAVIFEEASGEEHTFTAVRSSEEDLERVRDHLAELQQASHARIGAGAEEVPAELEALTRRRETGEAAGGRATAEATRGAEAARPRRRPERASE